MKTRFLYPITGGLLLACAAAVCPRTGPPGPETTLETRLQAVAEGRVPESGSSHLARETSGSRREIPSGFQSTRSVVSTPRPSSIPATVTIEHSAGVLPHLRQRSAKTRTTSARDPSLPVEPVRAVRLAGNFQLPAAILALARPESRKPDPIKSDVAKPNPLEPDAKNPVPADQSVHPVPTVETAKQNIADAFYQELSAIASETDSLPVEVTEEGLTTVIEPGPQVDQVRAHADELYRALFGDEAYGRKLMDGRLESQLPPEAVLTDN